MLALKQKLEPTGGVGDKCSVAPVEGKQILCSVGDFLERGGKKKKIWSDWSRTQVSGSVQPVWTKQGVSGPCSKESAPPGRLTLGLVPTGCERLKFKTGVRGDTCRRFRLDV